MTLQLVQLPPPTESPLGRRPAHPFPPFRKPSLLRRNSKPSPGNSARHSCLTSMRITFHEILTSLRKHSREAPQSASGFCACAHNENCPTGEWWFSPVSVSLLSLLCHLVPSVYLLSIHVPSLSMQYEGAS